MIPPFFNFEIHQKKKIKKKKLYIHIYRLLNISLLLNNIIIKIVNKKSHHLPPFPKHFWKVPTHEPAFCFFCFWMQPSFSYYKTWDETTKLLVM